jgi:cation transport regulator
MPYASTDDLPDALQTHLPLHAQEIYLAAFNSAWSNYAEMEGKERDAIAHRVAWAAVKRSYHKVGANWVEI